MSEQTIDTVADLQREFDELMGSRPTNKVVIRERDEITDRLRTFVRDETLNEATARRAYQKQVAQLAELQELERLFTDYFAACKTEYLAHVKHEPEPNAGAVRAWCERGAQLRATLVEVADHIESLGKRYSSMKQFVDGNVPPTLPLTQVVTD